MAGNDVIQFLTSDWLKTAEKTGKHIFGLKNEGKDVLKRDGGGLNGGEKDGIVTTSVNLARRRGLVTFGGVRLP